MAGFSSWDWLVFALSLLASLGVGIWASVFGKRTKTPAGGVRGGGGEDGGGEGGEGKEDGKGRKGEEGGGGGSAEEEEETRSEGDGGEAQEFLMGGRQMNPLAVSFSTMIGAISGANVIGLPAEMYAYGTQLWMNVIGTTLGFVFVHVVILVVMYPLRITSVYTYIEERFKSRALCSFTVFTTLIGTFFYVGLCSYSPSLALKTITGFPTWASVVLMGIVCTIYTAWGGVRAVVSTDVLQTFITFFGVIFIMVWATVEVGGVGEVWKLNNEFGRVEFLNVNPDPMQRHSLWLVIIQGYFTALLAFGMGQPQVQRVCAVGSWKKAQVSHYLTLALLLAVNSCCYYLGVSVFAHYAGCDPMATGDIQKPDQIVPYYVTDRLSSVYGVPGLFLASIYAGGLSSYSSQINAVAAVLWEAYLKESQWVANMAPKKRPYVNVLVSVITGGLGIVAGIVASQLGGIFQVGQIILGTIHSPLLGLFILGMCCPFANKVGGTVGFTASLAFNFWLTIGARLSGHVAPTLPFSDDRCPATDATTDVTEVFFLSSSTTEAVPIVDELRESDDVFPMYQLSYTLYSLFGVSITFLVGAIVSLISRPWSCEETGERYVHPTFYRIMRKWELRRTEGGPPEGHPRTDEGEFEDDVVTSFSSKVELVTTKL
ncbi:sodium-coupled monocarboxylate transporter 1-like [Oratosquilla oratoria]|uniref:sodium-coupled monocarboxylate transporter 1-like n=1 Tax=Oratosquilla oratoria TaxID=337810 RepID=UPI003F76E95F